MTRRRDDAANMDSGPNHQIGHHNTSAASSGKGISEATSSRSSMGVIDRPWETGGSSRVVTDYPAHGQSRTSLGLPIVSMSSQLPSSLTSMYGFPTTQVTETSTVGSPAIDLHTAAPPSKIPHTVRQNPGLQLPSIQALTGHGGLPNLSDLGRNFMANQCIPGSETTKSLSGTDIESLKQIKGINPSSTTTHASLDSNQKLPGEAIIKSNYMQSPVQAMSSHSTFSSEWILPSIGSLHRHTYQTQTTPVVNKDTNVNKTSKSLGYQSIDIHLQKETTKCSSSVTQPSSKTLCSFNEIPKNVSSSEQGSKSYSSVQSAYGIMSLLNRDSTMDKTNRASHIQSVEKFQSVNSSNQDRMSLENTILPPNKTITLRNINNAEDLPYMSCDHDGTDDKAEVDIEPFIQQIMDDNVHSLTEQDLKDADTISTDFSHNTDPNNETIILDKSGHCSIEQCGTSSIISISSKDMGTVTSNSLTQPIVHHPPFQIGIQESCATLSNICIDQTQLTKPLTSNAGIKNISSKEKTANQGTSLNKPIQECSVQSGGKNMHADEINTNAGAPETPNLQDQSQQDPFSEYLDNIPMPKNRRIKWYWFDQFPWLHYDQSTCIFTCTWCKKAGKHNKFSVGKLARTPKKDSFMKHEASSDHRAAAEVIIETEKSLQTVIEPDKDNAINSLESQAPTIPEIESTEFNSLPQFIDSENHYFMRLLVIKSEAELASVALPKPHSSVDITALQVEFNWMLVGDETLPASTWSCVVCDSDGDKLVQRELKRGNLVAHGAETKHQLHLASVPDLLVKRHQIELSRSSTQSKDTNKSGRDSQGKPLSRTAWIRKIKPYWFMSFKWLELEWRQQLLFCKICKTYSSIEDGGHSIYTSGCHPERPKQDTLRKHERSEIHTFAYHYQSTSEKNSEKTSADGSQIAAERKTDQLVEGEKDTEETIVSEQTPLESKNTKANQVKVNTCAVGGNPMAPITELADDDITLCSDLPADSQTDIESLFHQPQNMTLFATSSLKRDPNILDATMVRETQYTQLRDILSMHRGKKRNINPDWFLTYEWLECNLSNDLFYCKFCKQSQHCSTEPLCCIFISGKSAPKLPDIVYHEGSRVHRMAARAMMEHVGLQAEPPQQPQQSDKNTRVKPLIKIRRSQRKEKGSNAPTDDKGHSDNDDMDPATSGDEAQLHMEVEEFENITHPGNTVSTTAPSSEWHGNRFWELASQLRHLGVLCDISLIAKSPDGTAHEFKAHKLLLVCASEFFKAELQSAKSQDNYHFNKVSRYHFNNVTPRGLDGLLRFIYGSHVTPKSTEEALEYQQAAIVVMVPEAIKVFDQYVEQSAPSNDKRKLRIIEEMTETRDTKPTKKYKLSDAESMDSQPKAVLKEAVAKFVPPIFIQRHVNVGAPLMTRRPKVKWNFSKLPKSVPTCSLCGERFMKLGFLYRHQQRRHPGVAFARSGSRFQCDQCHKVYKTRRSLQVHQVVHTGERPYVCEFCGKNFAKREVLIQHLRTHSDKHEKRFKCTFCPKAFYKDRDCQRHAIAVHSGSKPFQCDLCGKSYPWLKSLQEHLLRHTNERKRKHTCKQCGTSFFRLYDLTRHSVTHTSSKPFVCEWCRQSFTQKGSMDKHKRDSCPQRPVSVQVAAAKRKDHKQKKLEEQKKKKDAGKGFVATKQTHEGRQQVPSDRQDENIVTIEQHALQQHLLSGQDHGQHEPQSHPHPPPSGAAPGERGERGGEEAAMDGPRDEASFEMLLRDISSFTVLNTY